jgi:glucan biosynthesis protein C
MGQGASMSSIIKPAPSARDVSIDYLRTTLTLMVVWHHSMLAYTTFARFDVNNYLASTHFVVDTTRWLFLDYAQYFNDVFFMSLMFCVSGLFAWPSLSRHGAGGFVRERFLRLGLPFALFVTTLMPITYYASWQLTGRDAGFVAYLRDTFFTHGWPPGPLWFIWVLLMFDLVAALIWAVGLQLKNLNAFHQFAERRPLLIGLGVFAVCAALYLPVLAVFGDRWVALGSPPFYFQLPRIGVYFAWFAFGIVIGAAGTHQGLLAAGSKLVRNWQWWIAASFIAFNVLVFTPRLLGAANLLSAYQRDAVEVILWIVSCVASCLGFLALFRGAVHSRRAWMDSLTRSAYTIYIVHFLFVLWLQRAFLNVQIHAGVKAIAVFIGSVLLSWLTARSLLSVPFVRKVL